MSRTAISINQIVSMPNTPPFAARGVLMTSGAINFDQANGHSVTSAFGMIPLGYPLYFVVSNTHTASHVITIKAGSSTYGGYTSIGDITFTVAAGKKAEYGPVVLHQHVQDASSTINVDADSGMTGTITAEIRKV